MQASFPRDSYRENCEVVLWLPMHRRMETEAKVSN
jgi:hypothetical protein